MRFPVRSFISLFSVGVLAFSAAICAKAQSTASPTTGNGTYVVVDPLANVRYNNRFDISVGLAYDHMKAGPTLV